MRSHGTMRRIAVVANDTGSGKTVVTAALYSALTLAGRGTFVQKWVSTGDKNGLSTDLLTILAAVLRKAGEPVDLPPGRVLAAKITSEKRNDLAQMNPYSFPVPVSPHLAGRLAGRPADPARIDACVEHARKSGAEILLVETAGGLLTPFNEDLSMLDMVRREKCEIILVVPDILGAINQALLCLNELRRRRMKILAVVLNGVRPEKKSVRRENGAAIMKFSGCPRILHFPGVRDQRTLLKSGTALLRSLKI